MERDMENIKKRSFGSTGAFVLLTLSCFSWPTHASFEGYLSKVIEKVLDAHTKYAEELEIALHKYIAQKIPWADKAQIEEMASFKNRPVTLFKGDRAVTLIPEQHSDTEKGGSVEPAARVAKLLLLDSESKIFIEDPYVLDDVSTSDGIKSWRKEWATKAAFRPLGIIGQIGVHATSSELAASLNDVLPLEPRRADALKVKSSIDTLKGAALEHEKAKSNLATSEAMRKTVCRIPGLGTWLKGKLVTEADVEAAKAECVRREEEYFEASRGKDQPGEPQSPEVRSIGMAQTLSSKVAEGRHAWAVMGANHLDQVKDALLESGWKIWTPGL